MMNRYLRSLTPEQEARVLTERMEPYSPSTRATIGLPVHRECGCLVMTAEKTRVWTPYNGLAYKAGYRYEDLCKRLGVTHVNAAIRNRILTNIARRWQHRLVAV